MIVFCTVSFSGIFSPVEIAFFGVSGGSNSLSSAFASSGVKAFLLPLVPFLTPLFPFLGVANMSIFRNYTTDNLGRLCFLPAIPSFVDPDEEESFSVSYDRPKNYFFGQIGARPLPSSVKSDPSFGRQKKVKEVRFVNDLNTTLRGIPPTYMRRTSWRLRGWTATEAHSFWQEKYRGYPYWECKDRCDWWFSLGFSWGWDTRYPLGAYHSSACW